MLKEIINVKQYETEGYRRWFSDDFFDLIIWYEDKKIVGFQLCYDKQGLERSLTWLKDKGFSHNKIDDGEKPGHSKMTPILVADGIFEKEKIAEAFKKASKNIDPVISSFVYSKLIEYPE
ncbi:MAG: hypothetical protein JXB88_01940 [Spirochaetales bacterium]|nr:hypothetical protein [Spirochaetales bacterium]